MITPHSDVTILIVDENPINIRLLSQALKGFGRPIFALCGQDALKLIRTNRVDLVLLDIEMPGMSGYETCTEILSICPEIPIVFVTSHQGEKEEIDALESGGTDFIQKPFNPTVIRARVSAYLRAKKQADSLRNLLHQDPLTEIANRRYLDEQIYKVWHDCGAKQLPLSLLMIDIDHFKKYNDHYGHPKGDRCLQLVAKTICQSVRPPSIVARYGGEEFSVILPISDSKQSLVIAEQICDSVRALQEPHELSETSQNVSISIGLASIIPNLPEDERSLGPNRGLGIAELLFKAADQSLYQAKLRGRNRVFCAQPDFSSSQLETTKKSQTN